MLTLQQSNTATSSTTYVGIPHNTSLCSSEAVFVINIRTEWLRSKSASCMNVSPLSQWPTERTKQERNNVRRTNQLSLWQLLRNALKLTDRLASTQASPGLKSSTGDTNTPRCANTVLHCSHKEETGSQAGTEKLSSMSQGFWGQLCSTGNTSNQRTTRSTTSPTGSR